MRLYHQAERDGAWDPRDIDLGADARKWTRLTEIERDLLLRLTVLFHAGEEGMTRDILPLSRALAREGRVEDEIFLTTLRADEARHTEFFRRVVDEVCRGSGDLGRYHTPNFRWLFSEELPRVMHRLLADSSPAAQAEALVTYTIVSEGVLSETGHYLYATALRRRGLMHGLLQGLRRVQRDEARHMTYGVYLLAGAVAQDGGVWDVIQRRMDTLLVTSLGIITEFFAPYPVPPFGLTLEETVTHAMTQFARRSARVERAKGRGAEIAASAGDPIAELVEWLADQVGPLVVRRGERDRPDVVVVEVAHDAGAASLLITREVLDHYLVDEVLAALTEHESPRRLAVEPRLRLACVEGNGGIIVQQPA